MSVQSNGDYNSNCNEISYAHEGRNCESKGRLKLTESGLHCAYTLLISASIMFFFNSTVNITFFGEELHLLWVNRAGIELKWIGPLEGGPFDLALTIPCDQHTL